MTLKRSMIPALLVTALFGSSALADPTPAASRNDAYVSWQEAESGSPDSPDYKDRVINTGGQDTNAAWQALESDNPHSVDFKGRQVGKSANPNAGWAASEAGNPHNPRPVTE